MKRCTNCKRDLPKTAFAPKYYQCRDCKAAYDRTRDPHINRARVKAWIKANPERRRPVVRKYRLKKLYGITEEQYEELFTAQEGKCAICRRPPKKIRLAVDHSHKTGAVRGLLCYKCNYLLLGKFRDDVELFEQAATYLRKYQ